MPFILSVLKISNIFSFGEKSYLERTWTDGSQTRTCHKLLNIQEMLD